MTAGAPRTLTLTPTLVKMGERKPRVLEDLRNFYGLSSSVLSAVEAIGITRGRESLITSDFVEPGTMEVIVLACMRDLRWGIRLLRLSHPHSLPLHQPMKVIITTLHELHLWNTYGCD